MVVLDKLKTRFSAVILIAMLSGASPAQIPNIDAITLFSRSSVTGTARTAGTGGAFSSVGADMGSMELNPAGLGLYRSSDIAITPGLRVAADNSIYNNTSATGSHTILQFAHAGAVLTKKIREHNNGGPVNPWALKFITIGINYQTDNSYDRVQNFGMINTNHSLIDNYAAVSNKYYNGSPLWSLGSYIFNQAGILSQIGTNPATSNVRAPVLQSGALSTTGATHRISLGFGGNLGDKLFFGLSLGVPILNYTVNAAISEGATTTDSVTHFQNYSLSSTVSETGVGVTGKVGLIYKPVPWMRFGVAYSLPTWYFLSENNSGDLVYNFDTSSSTYEVGPGSLPPIDYRLRTPMKGTVGASFYFKEHGFLSVDYDFQNLGSTRYSALSNDSANLISSSLNSYLKSTYRYSHTVRIGGEAAIKKFRIRAGYSYTSSPFKKGQNYAGTGYDASIHSATFGMGLKFKSLYIDLAYIFSYTKDGVSPNYAIPLDPINSTYMTHNVLLTLGFKIPTKGDKGGSNSSPGRSRKPSNGELPKYIDPGDKSY